jgi:hypothetical protein
MEGSGSGDAAAHLLFDAPISRRPRSSAWLTSGAARIGATEERDLTSQKRD